MVDADDIQVAEDFDSALLHKTRPIEDFLASHGAEKFIVLATKGFGKTLVLKSKRLQLQQSMECLPDNSLLDKPVGDRVFGADMMSLYSDSTRPWANVWLISIVTAVLKRLDLHYGLDVHPLLRGLIADDNLRGVIDHFVNVLGFRRRELFRAAEDTATQLVPRLRNIDTSVAIFIDSVDEYFQKHIGHTTGRESGSGRLSPNVWYFSQMGLLEAAYELRRTTHHLKVFAAIRKEAFARLERETPMIQQYRGSVVDLTYARDSLAEIFSNNIRHERRVNLVAADRLRTDPITAFLGRDTIVNAYTGEEERLFDYIYRHTLMRPRDLMTIGQKLSALRPERRRGTTAIKEAVHAAAVEIGEEYLNEIRPYLEGIDFARLFELLPAHVLTRDDLEEIFERYNESEPARHPDGLGDRHVFCALHRAGLLGHVTDGVLGDRKMQRFMTPGEALFDPDATLPRADHYVVHPVLTEIILRHNPEYVQRVDRTNIIGPGRPWLDPDGAGRRSRELFVLKADIKGYSDLMDDPDKESAVRTSFDTAVKTHASRCIISEIVEGDSLLLVADDPKLLLTATVRIMQDLYEAPGHPLLRVAADRGPVRLMVDASGDYRADGGHPLRTVARIEPHVNPNEIWVTDRFHSALEQSDSYFAATPVEPPVEARAEDRPGYVNVKKAHSQESDLFVKLYRVTAR